jgi:DNA-binding PadR family transcriptional regulator
MDESKNGDQKRFRGETKLKILSILFGEEAAVPNLILERLRDKHDIKIKGPTLNTHLKDFLNKGYVIKKAKGLYSITDKGRDRYEKWIWERNINEFSNKLDYPYILGIRASFGSIEPQKLVSELGYDKLPEKIPEGWGAYMLTFEDSWQINHFNPPGIGMSITIENNSDKILFFSGLIGPDEKGIIENIIEEDKINAPYQILVCEIGYHLFPIDAILKQNNLELYIEGIFVGRLKNNGIIGDYKNINQPWSIYKNSLIKKPLI